MGRWVLGATLVAGLSAPPTAPGRLESVYTEAQARRGRAVYQRYCLSCHGDRLQGGEGPALAGPKFIQSWSSRRATLHDFFYETRTFIPKDRPGSLGERQYLDIVAYILQRNGYPAGTRELTAEPTALSKIRIEPPR